ncbi:hypothetical protein MPSEU_000577800 [Mayamaea pseudoterrestris]|nr:hypothetical protein MPSEU_000577800 [Mayamaea pseudoterrestris]
MTLSDSSAPASEPWTPGNPKHEQEARSILHTWPLDSYNAETLNEVHPRDYKSPSSTYEEYDLIAIGAGAGGLVSARQAARRGGKTAMISEQLAGGDCLNVGCVPSKALLRAAKAIAEVERASEFGVVLPPGPVKIDFAKVMERLRAKRALISHVDGHATSEQAGTHVFQGKGRFISPTSIQVGETVLHFKKAVVATGGRPHIPNIPGLREAPYLTNEILFNLEALPPRMVILGAGAVGLEMAQSFARFGSKVTVITSTDQLFHSKFGDGEAANILKQELKSSGVDFIAGQVTIVKTISKQPEKAAKEFPLMQVTIETPKGSNVSIDCDALLIAAGRDANVEDVGLDAGNVEFEVGKGVKINDLAQSVSNPNIYAVGDCVAGVPRLTHMSGEMAKLVVQNALFQDKWKLSSLVVPATMYTEPEYATVGIYSAELAEQRSMKVDTYRTGLEQNDRAILEGSNVGFCKIICEKGTDKIVGATIVAERAGEMINEVTLAMKNDIGLYQIGRNIHCYPTTGEAVGFCGVQYINSKWQRLDGSADKVTKESHSMSRRPLNNKLECSDNEMSDRRINDSSSSDESDSGSSSSSSFSSSASSDDNQSNQHSSKSPASSNQQSIPFLRRRNTSTSSLTSLVRVESEDQRKRQQGPCLRKWILLRRRVRSASTIDSHTHENILSACGTLFLGTSFTVWLILMLFPGDSVSYHSRTRGRRHNHYSRAQSNNNQPESPFTMKRFIRGVAGSIVHRMDHRAKQDRAERSDQKRRNAEALQLGCVRPDWQTRSYTTLDIHEIDLTSILFGKHLVHSSPSPEPGYLSAGLWRSVWVVYPRDAKTPTVLKMMKPEHPVDDRNMDRHRRDAIVMERLTSNHFVASIYAHVGYSVLTEYVRTTLDTVLFHSHMQEEGSISYAATATRETPMGRLKLALGVANGIRALHSVTDGPIVHADVQAKQFLVTPEGIVKVNDFNRCRFMAHHNESHASCSFKIPSAPGKHRAPEEYSYTQLDQQLDIYSMAHVLYGILSGDDPWRGWSSSEVKRVVMDGYKPVVPEQFRVSNTTDERLHQLMLRTYTLNPTERITAAELVHEIEALLQQHANDWILH